MVVQKTTKQQTEQKKIEQIEAIYQDFLNKIQKIEKARDEKIAAIVKKAEERQAEKIRQEMK